MMNGDRGRARAIRYALTVPPEDICYISWTFDAHEGTALLRTDDARVGAVSLLMSSCYIEEAEMIIDALISEGIAIERGAIAEDD